jgi:hypothetical protein
MTKLKNVAVAIASIVIFTSITQAQTSSEERSFVNHEEPMSVKYLGNEGDYLAFRVTIKADLGNNTSFVVADQTEGDLYSSALTSNEPGKIIKVEKRDGQVLDFKLVVGRQTTFLKSFTVDTKEEEKTTVAEEGVSIL